MRRYDFGLKIIGGVELDNGLTLLEHNQQYRIRLTNFNLDLRADASVEIDGKFIGRFRLKPYSSVSIDRPTNDSRIFTYYREGSKEAEEFAFKDHPSLGLISVIFFPEIESETVVAPKFLEKASNQTNYARGMTGLSGESCLKYELAEEITYDLKKKIVISTRLVCHNSPRPFI